MDLAAIQSMVRYLTKEPYSVPQFATNARVLEFGNLAQLEIASRTKTYMSTNVPNNGNQSSDMTTAGQWRYAYPSDCLELMHVKVGIWDLKRSTIKQVNDSYGMTWWQYTGIPFMYFPIHDSTGKNFGIFYTPAAAYSLNLFYIRKPTAMANSTDTPDLDRRLDMAVVYWTCERVMEGRREQGYRAGYWLERYEAEITKYNLTADQSLEPVDFLGSYPTTSD